MDEMQRWEILRLHIEDGITLTDLARSTGISTRTLSRWAARYRADGIHGLRTTTRSDAGAHRISAELVAYIEQPRAHQATAIDGRPAPPGELPSTATIGETTQLRHGAWHHPSA